MDSPGDLDRISALPDNVLHLILASVQEATAVTRTAALSRRWRRVWTRAQHLELRDTRVRRGSFVGFVNWVLAQRGYADIGSLDIHVYRECCCAPPGRVNAWLRYAMRTVVKSFSLYLWRKPPPRFVRRLPVPVLLPGHGRMASLSLYLSEHDRFRLPVLAAARYEALTELRLYRASFDEKAAPGGGRTLGDFVSSCCPRLRKLYICSPTGLPQLVIRSEALEELTLLLARDLQMLDVTAPSMRVLKLNLCFGDPMSLDGNDRVANNVVRIAAPRLAEIAMHSLAYNERRPELEIHHPASVRRLSDIHLDMHGSYCCDKDAGLWLLENCPGVEHIAVSIGHGFGSDRDHLVDLTSEGAAPFACVRSMVVEALDFSDSHLVSSISSLLSRCPHLRSLSIDTTGTDKRPWTCFCDEVDTWKFHPKFSLGYLEEVTIRGFLGEDEDMELLTLLFECSNSIRNLTLRDIPSFSPQVSLKWMMAEEHEKDTESIDQKLVKIPRTDRGYWHFGKDATWTSYAAERAMDHGCPNLVWNLGIFVTVYL